MMLMIISSEERTSSVKTLFRVVSEYSFCTASIRWLQLSSRRVTMVVMEAGRYIRKGEESAYQHLANISVLYQGLLNGVRLLNIDANIE